MQRILLDHQKKKKAGEKIDVPELDVVVSRIEKETGYDIERLHGALDALKESSPKQHEVIILRFFGGLTIAQTAETLGLTTGAIENRWKLARAKLRKMLEEPA